MLNSNTYTYTSSHVFVVLVCSFIYTLTEGCVLCCFINVTSHLMSTFRFTGFFCRHFHSMNRKTTVSEAPHTAKQSSDSMLCCMIITPDQWVKSNREALWSSSWRWITEKMCFFYISYKIIWHIFTVPLTCDWPTTIITLVIWQSAEICRCRIQLHIPILLAVSHLSLVTFRLSTFYVMFNNVEKKKAINIEILILKMLKLTMWQFICRSNTAGFLALRKKATWRQW